jgi:hypothetical protein
LRAARRSEGGFGNSSDGGCGGAIEAHAVNISGIPTASKNFGIKHVIAEEIRLTDRTPAKLPRQPLDSSAISA